MDISDGNLSFTATMDTSSLDKSRDLLVKYFKDMGLSAEEAGRRADEAMKQVEAAVSEAMSSVETDAEAMEVLKGALEEIQEQMESMEDGAAKEFLGGIAEGIGEVVNELEQAQGMESPVEGLEEGYTSAREAMRQMREELIQMKMNGQENTEEYQRLLEKLGMLQDAMSDTQQATRGMASDTQNLDAVMGAAQLTAGGFSAIMGALNLVGAGEDTKELAEAQKKLQSVMAITTGLMSVQNALQKQSAIMLGIMRLKALAAAKAQATLNAETGKYVIAAKSATLAQKAFNKVANANPYVLLATAVLSVIGALFAFTSGTKEAERQQKSYNDELERQLSILNKLSGAYNTMQSTEINKLNNILDLLKAQGASVEVIRDAEDQIDEAEKKRIDAQKEEFKDYLDNAQMYEDKLKELQGTIRETNEEGIKAKERMNRAGGLFSTDYSSWEVPLNNPNYIADITDSQVDQAVEDLETVQKIVDKIHQIQQEEDNFQTRLDKREAERAAEDKKRKEDAYKAAVERRKQDLEEEKRYQEELQKARERAEDLELGTRSDNVNTRVAKVELDYSRQIAEAETKLKEASEKNQLKLVDEYKRQIVALKKQQQQEINKIYAEEEQAQEQALNEILDNYKGYDAKRRAIEETFAEDIRKLTEKRDEYDEGSEEWIKYNQAINEALQQQEESLKDLEVEYGELNQLGAKRESLEKQILIIANKIKSTNDEAERDALLKELARLKQELKDVNKEIDEMNESLEESKDSLANITAGDVVADLSGSFKELAGYISEASGASKETAENIGIVADGIASIGSQIAQGNLYGAIMEAINWAVDGMITLYERTKAENEALAEFQAQLDKIHQSLNINNGEFETMFGNNSLGKIQALSGEYHRLEKEAENLMKFYTNNDVANIFDLSKYRIGGLGNYNLEDLAKEWKMNLFDESGYGYNTDFLQKVLDQYGDKLSEDEKKLLQGMLNYSGAFQTAMEEIASYLESLFGQVADTIADQFIDSFLESGQAAMDFGVVASNVAKQMAKDFIKSMVSERLAEYFGEDFKSIMSDNRLSAEEKQAQIMAILATAQASVDELQPAIQAYLEAMSQFFGASEDINEAAMSGNLLQSASQDSVDLLNGQLNAIRVNQALTTNRIDDVLLQLSGIRTDMNNGLGQSVRHLESIDRNTSSGGSILSQLGIWLG